MCSSESKRLWGSSAGLIDANKLNERDKGLLDGIMRRVADVRSLSMSKINCRENSGKSSETVKTVNSEDLVNDESENSSEDSVKEGSEEGEILPPKSLDVPSNDFVSRDCDALRTHPLREFHRHLICEQITARWDNMVVVEAESEVGRSSTFLPLKVFHVKNREIRDKLMKTVNMDQLNKINTEIRATVGFRQVMDVLSALRVPIIGHNCFTDLLHIFSKFHAPLPDSVEEFARRLHVLFPVIVDTKLLAAVLRRKMVGIVLDYVCTAVIEAISDNPKFRLVSCI